MRSIIHAGLAAAFVVAMTAPAFAECAGHVKQQSVQVPTTTTTTTATQSTPAKPNG